MNPKSLPTVVPGMLLPPLAEVVLRQPVLGMEDLPHQVAGQQLPAAEMQRRAVVRQRRVVEPLPAMVRAMVAIAVAAVRHRRCNVAALPVRVRAPEEPGTAVLPAAVLVPQDMVVAAVPRGRRRSDAGDRLACRAVVDRVGPDTVQAMVCSAVWEPILVEAPIWEVRWGSVVDRAIVRRLVPEICSVISMRADWPMRCQGFLRRAKVRSHANTASRPNWRINKAMKSLAMI